MRIFLLSCWLGFFPSFLYAQARIDTLYEWRGYIHPGQARVQVFETPPDDDRTQVAILQELALNQGPPIHHDFTYLVEELGRTFGFDPANAYWVLHWGRFSFVDERDSPKELFLRATFRRMKDGRLGSPSWRLIRREEVEALTDRLFR